MTTFEDALGRESKTWLPYVNSLDYLSPEEIKKKISTTYGGDPRAFNESVYEASPLNRVIKQYGAGNSWATHPVSTDYLANTATGVLACKLYKLDNSGMLIQGGNYSGGSLYVNKVTDEDGNPSYSFVDMLGQTVLTRQTSAGETYDTYYVYDDSGNLRFVLPPAYQDTPELSLYGYQYKYDARNRCIEKTLPGCQPIYYVYDRADNPVLSQDGVQRTRHEWTFNLYDTFGRMVVTGLIQTQSSREQLADKYKDILFKASLAQNCSYDLNKADNLFGYETSVLSGYSVKVLIVNYYDRYDFLSFELFQYRGLDYVDDTFFGVKHESAQGLLTGTYVRQLDDLGKGEFSVHYYDVKGREVQKRSSLLPYGHSDYTWTKYNFTGQPLCVKFKHSSVYGIYPYPPGDPRGDNSQEELYEYEYDNAGRAVKTYHTHNKGERILLSESVYDDLGRLQEKRRHNGMDTVRYEYNIRNWVSAVKSRSFVQMLYYETGFSAPGFPSRYNGNITGIKYEQNGHSYNYLFHYDGLNRLTTANSYDKTGNGIPYSELYEYDKMGNITYLERKLGANKTDALNFEYTGNQIKKVSSVSPALGYDFGSMTYPDLSDASIEYYYDNNGNLIKNLDKGVVATRHNFLNLPDTIQFQNGNQIINSYLADGRKVKAVYKTYSTGIVVPQDAVYHGNASYDVSTDEWDSHYMYRSWYGHSPRMFMVQTPEGYVGADYVGIDSHRNYAYYYYVHDHLGNVRITRNSQGYYSDQSLEYYPSGVLFDRSAEKERQPYMFGGKELVSMHGLNEYDFTGRWQDPVIPSFTSIDPLCEKYYSVSPYVYCVNNPVRYIDPDGKDWYEYTDKDGNTQTMWRKSQDKTYKDGSGNIWNNIGENYLSINGDNATLFTQHKNDKGELYLSSSSYNLANEKSTKTLTSTLGDILSEGSAVAGGLGGYAEGSNVTFRLTNSKGALEFKFYTNGWKGNQWVTTNSISRIGKGVGYFGKMLGGLGTLASAYQFRQASTLEGQFEHGLDVFMGGIGFFPVVGTGVSLYWPFGGKKIHYMYVNKVLMPQIKMGINPGLPAYQPFK